MPSPINIEKAIIKLRTANVILVIAAACLLLFLFIAFFVVHQHREAFDQSIIRFVSIHNSPALIQTMLLITFLGSSMFLLPAYLTLIALMLVRKYFYEAINIAISASLSWVVLSGIKILFHRHRPDLPLVNNFTTYSFPSAHTFSSWIFFNTAAFFLVRHKAASLNKYLIVISIQLISLTIGCSRIILNVHYTTDVIAGLCLATSWLILSYLIYNNYRPSKKG